MTSEQAIIDGLCHHLIIEHIIDSGRAPSLALLAHAAGIAADDVKDSLSRLHEKHGLVLHPNSHDVWVIHPFSLVPTLFYVESGHRGWWAPCIWCALGITVLTGNHATIHTRVGGETGELALRVRDGIFQPEGCVAHFPIPASRAWDNVHRFCGSTLVFACADDVDGWCDRHGIKRGDVQPLSKVSKLAKVWYGGYRNRDWRKWTLDEARSHFAQVGLHGDSWQLPDRKGRF